EVRVEVLEKADLPVLTGRVLDGHLFEVEVPVKVDGIAEVQTHAELRVHQVGVPDQRLVLVVDVTLPAIVASPCEQPIDPDPETGRLADGVVLQANVRVEDVAELVTRVERDKEVAVSKRQVAGHARLVSGGAAGRSEIALRIRDHARDVAALQQLGANEGPADAAPHPARGEGTRDLPALQRPPTDP